MPEHIPTAAFFKQKEDTNENLEDAPVKWVVKDDQSLAVIESEEFQDFLRLIKPGIRLPSYDTLKRRIINKNFSGTRQSPVTVTRVKFIGYKYTDKILLVPG